LASSKFRILRSLWSKEGLKTFSVLKGYNFLKPQDLKKLSRLVFKVDQDWWTISLPLPSTPGQSRAWIT